MSDRDPDQSDVPEDHPAYIIRYCPCVMEENSPVEIRLFGRVLLVIWM